MWRTALVSGALSLVATGALGCDPVESEIAVSLDDQWYDAVTAGCGLDAAHFQLYPGAAPIGFTSESLWSTFDAVPALSTSHYYNPAQANAFSSDYGAMIFSLTPQPSTLEEDLGECYVPFMAAWKASMATDMLELWQSWSPKSCPGSYSVGSADIQALTHDPVVLAQSTWIEANQALTARAYTTTIAMLKSMLESGPSKTVSMDSSTLPWSRAAGQSGDGGASLFPDWIAGPPGASSTRFSGGTIKINATFDHLITLTAGPLSSPISSDPTLGTYEPWYTPAVMGMAFATPDETQWRTGVKPDWQSTFGEGGNMQRMCTAVVVVDGVTISITSTATFSGDEVSGLQAAADRGLWPFFQASVSGGWENSVRLNADGTITITSTSPAGNPSVLGVLVSSAADLWG